MSESLTRVLVVANQTASSPVLVAELLNRARSGPVLFSLLVPALNSRLRHWVSDSDEAHLTALTRAEHARSVMAEHDLSMRVEVGDGVPLAAIADALSRFPAEELIISTLPVRQSHWLERDLITHARQRFVLPVLHVVSAPTEFTPRAERLSAFEVLEAQAA